MPNPVPTCSHIKANGEACGSPAVSGSPVCYHHSAMKMALSKPSNRAPEGGFAPIPFVFPEDRASMQINFFLLLQAFNEQRIDMRTYKSMLSMLKAMAKILGKTGSLVEDRDQGSELRAQEGAEQRAAVSEKAASGETQNCAAASRGANPGKEKIGGIVGLNAGDDEIRPEACFLNEVPAPVYAGCLSAEGRRIVDAQSEVRMAR